MEALRAFQMEGTLQKAGRPPAVDKQRAPNWLGLIRERRSGGEHRAWKEQLGEATE